MHIAAKMTPGGPLGEWLSCFLGGGEEGRGE